MENKKTNKTIVNILTVDVEEWYQTVLFFNTSHNTNEKTDLSENIKTILGLLDRYQAKATFFVLGSVAENYPNIVKQIYESGHEIASHGYSHKVAYKMPYDAFIKDVEQSLDILNTLVKKPISGYRASTWSLPKDIKKTMHDLKSLGFIYDSSLYPVSLNPFRYKEFQRFPYEIIPDFKEFPPSTYKVLKTYWPFSGGTFLRFYSYSFIHSQMKSLNAIGHPALVYFHPWEFTRINPQKNIPLWKSLIQFKNLNSVKPKLELLLKDFKFTSIINKMNVRDE